MLFPKAENFEMCKFLGQELHLLRQEAQQLRRECREQLALEAQSSKEQGKGTGKQKNKHNLRNPVQNCSELADVFSGLESFIRFFKFQGFLPWKSEICRAKDLFPWPEVRAGMIDGIRPYQQGFGYLCLD